VRNRKDGRRGEKGQGRERGEVGAEGGRELGRRGLHKSNTLRFNDRNESMHGHCVSFWGPGVPENSYGDTAFQEVPSPHPWSSSGCSH